MSRITYYAIGDVHGMDDMLAALHEAIWADVKAQGNPVQLVHCGDYVDRGPQSWQVVERLMALEQAGDAVCLLGNHEDMMVSALRHKRAHNVEDWLHNGGRQTLASYGGEFCHVPDEHLVWMESLPFMLVDERQKLVFVHAGIEPGDFPHIRREVALWTRSPRFFDDTRWPGSLDGWMVVHGHTPTICGFEYCSYGPRINVDTGACFGARLTCARLRPKKAGGGHAVSYCSVGPDLVPVWEDARAEAA